MGTTETDQGHASRVRLAQDGVDFLGIASPRNNPDAQKRTAGFGTSRASLEVSSSPSFRAPPAEGLQVLWSDETAVPGPPSLASLRRLVFAVAVVLWAGCQALAEWTAPGACRPLHGICLQVNRN